VTREVGQRCRAAAERKLPNACLSVPLYAPLLPCMRLCAPLCPSGIKRLRGIERHREAGVFGVRLCCASADPSTARAYATRAPARWPAHPGSARQLKTEAPL
jgi:hypothetical protein